jgi:uncharacterized protein YbjT (DUF2867 family)
MILVIGATGTVGSLLLSALLPAHAGDIRALTRRPGVPLPAGVERAVGDLDEPADVRRAVTGADKVFVLTDGQRIAERDTIVAKAAADAGVRHLVKLSVLSAGHNAADPITMWHRQGEQAVVDSDVPWTFLRPTGFMSNALQWAPALAWGSTIQAPFAAGRTALIDPADIARVAAAVLTEPGHEGSAYDLTGPEPLSPADQVRVLAEVLGRDLHYAEIDASRMLADMERYGMPTPLADAVVQLLGSALLPFNAEVSADVQRVTGRTATSFREWAEQHRGDFTTTHVEAVR